MDQVVSQASNGIPLTTVIGGKGDYERDDYAWKANVGGGISDLREETAQTRADIRESIQNLQLHNAQQFSHVHEKACDAEKEAIRAQYEGKIQTIQTGKEIENRVSDFERSADDSFCELEKNVLREGSLTREVVRDQGERTREKIAECCCETKEAFAALERRTDAQFTKLSEQHILQVLAETKDELTEARFAAILARLPAVPALK